jgi:hypothetical protein
MDDNRLEHLKMIQGVIARMAQNSFLIKGWSVTLVTAVIALALRESQKSFVLLALYPAIVFWGLDAYYLRQERLFRQLYDSVRSSTVDSTTAFSMDASEVAKLVPTWLFTLFVLTVVGLHGMVVLLVAVILALK